MANVFLYSFWLYFVVLEKCPILRIRKINTRKEKPHIANSRITPTSGAALITISSSPNHFRISDCLLYPLARMGGQGLEIIVECRMNHLLMYCSKSIR